MYARSADYFRHGAAHCYEGSTWLFSKHSTADLTTFVSAVRWLKLTCICTPDCRLATGRSSYYCFMYCHTVCALW
jgi:hypothetical protein